MEEFLIQEKTEKLWQWFVRNENRIKETIETNRDSELIIEELNELVLDFGPLGWDIGKNEEDAWFFTISPNGDENRLRITQKIMSEAPTFLNWVFQDAKPAVQWNGILTTFDDSFNEVEIDTSNWSYIAYQCSESQLELVVEIGEDVRLTNDQLEDALHAFLIKQVGEKFMITTLAKWEVVHRFDAEDQEDKNGVAELQQHLFDFIA